MSKYSELSQIGSAPISKDAPAGESVSYEADYDLLEGEIKKLQSISGTAVNWNLVIEKSADILSKKSKDLTVASWLCLALFKESKLEGLTVGLGVYYDTIYHFWQIMYPSLKRIRRRANVVEWLFENIDKTFSNLKFGMEDENNLKLCNELIVKITDQLDEKLGDIFPVAIFNKVKRDLTGRIKEFEVKKIPPPPTAKQAKQIKVAPASPVIPQKTEINNKENANKALKESLVIIKKAAAFLQNVNDANPLYYRLIRVSSWSVIQNLPSHTNFVTPIPEIQAAVIKAFDDLEGKGDWQLLLKGAETQFVNNPLWLDLQRYSYIASDNLGEKYEPVKEVITNEFI
jgi:type VI secretion system ImpA/VasJ family protein